MREVVSVDGGLALERVQTAADGTRKLVFMLTTGPAVGAAVETVLIPVVRRGGARPRLTICVSSQVGCAMNCQFCLTGRMGLRCVSLCYGLLRQDDVRPCSGHEPRLVASNASAYESDSFRCFQFVLDGAAGQGLISASPG